MSVRSLAEMRFAVSLSTCPKCGSSGPTKIEMYGDRDMWSYAGKCPGCGDPRNFDFRTSDPLELPKFPRYHLGGAEPSSIIQDKQLEAELRRLEPHLQADPRDIPLAQWSEQTQINDRAATAAVELCKFPGQERMVALRDRLIARANRFSADAPRIWMLKTGNKLHVSEEIRGLLNQVTEQRVPAVAELRSYLEMRGTLDGDTVKVSGTGDVSTIRVSQESTALVAELALRASTLADIEEATGPTTAAGDGRRVAEKVVSAHLVRFEIDAAVTRVTVSISLAAVKPT